MIVKKQAAIPPANGKKLWFWLSLTLSAMLVGLGLWYIVHRVGLAAIGEAMAVTDVRYLALSVIVMIVTLLVKAWRWRMLLTPGNAPPFTALFWAMMMGQYVNLVVPFLRLGEIARMYALKRQTGISQARTLSTLVVEKVLEMLMLVLTVLVLLPVTALPEFIGNPSLTVGAVAFLVLLTLYILAYQTELIVAVCRRLEERLPSPLRKYFLPIVISGLEGLAALKDRRLTASLLGSSLVIAVLAVLTPYLLFSALQIHLGLIEAALIHVVASVVTTPPSTPGKIGVLDGVVAFMLLGFGIGNEAVIISYTIVYHLVVMLPQIILGSIAASRTGWRWQQTAVSSGQ